MEQLRNPFAVRNGKIILIEDLTANERGLKCQCKCPACKSDFIARLGDVNIHHFAHSKDSCDEVLAYTSGLYRLIHQILSTGCPFYLPALVVAYWYSIGEVLTENNIDSHVKLTRENDMVFKIKKVFEKQAISFKSVEFCLDNKGHIEALELTYRNSRMAIKVMPPDTVCRTTVVSPHKDMATLAVNFQSEADVIQSSNSDTFQEYLLSDRLNKRWICNPKAKNKYREILEENQKDYQMYIENQKRLEEIRRIEAARVAEARRIAAQNYHAKENRCQAERAVVRVVQEARLREEQAMGYEQVKGRFAQQTEQVVDSFGCKWFLCILCGRIQPESEFWMHEVNRGKCRSCENS